MKLRSGISIVRGSSISAIIIKTPEGSAKITVTTLEQIVKLNKHENKKRKSAFVFDASDKLNNFIQEELKK